MSILIAFIVGALIGHWGLSKMYHASMEALFKGKPQEGKENPSERSVSGK